MTREEKQCDKVLRRVDNELTIRRAVNLLKDLGYDLDGAILVLMMFWEAENPKYTHTPYEPTGP